MNSQKYRALALRWRKQEIRPLLIVALILFSIRSSLADWNVVPTGSMQPTILVGDRVLVKFHKRSSSDAHIRAGACFCRPLFYDG